jgi:hypothetical protein
MDALDQLAAPAADLLRRVDQLVTRCGAPIDHPMWTSLHRVRALPGAAVGAVCELRPGPLAAAGIPLRQLASGYADTAVPAPPIWRGAGADHFGYRWTALCAHLDRSAERLVDTARYLEAVADWLAHVREALARTLAVALVSTEAVLVRTADDPRIVALPAADLAAFVLTPIAQAYDEGRQLPDGWTPRLAELPFRETLPAAPSTLTATEVLP